MVEERLAFYRVAAPVRFERRPVEVLAAARPARARAGPGARGLRGAATSSPKAHLAGTVGGQPVLVARAGDMPAEGYVLHAESAAAAAAAAALQSAGAVPVDRETLDVLRIEDGRPWYGPDVTEENLLHETGLVREYHSPTKGCYVGQEVIARLEARGGNVNRALRGLRLKAPAEAGAAVTSEGKEVGRITTAGVSPRLGPIAHGHTCTAARFEPGTRVEVAGAAATVVRLPFEVRSRDRRSRGLKIYTKSGDGGHTGLIGGARVRKDDPRVAAYGDVDELNAALGVVLAHSARQGAEPGSCVASSGTSSRSARSSPTRGPASARAASRRPSRRRRSASSRTTSTRARRRWSRCGPSSCPAARPLGSFLHLARGGLPARRAQHRGPGPRRAAWTPCCSPT